MKKLTFFAIGLAIASSLIFYACEDTLQEDVSSPQIIEEDPSGIYGTRCIIREFCIPKVERGTRAWFNPALCLPGNPYQCNYFTGREICIPVIIDCFWVWDERWRNPWDWRDYLDPRDIYDFRRDIGDIIDPREDFGMFRINENLLGMQYFDVQPGLIDKDVFNVSSSIELDAETAESLGLKGNIIPAGKYPVAYNEKNGTFNAIVSVETYPISRTKQVVIGNFESGDLTKFLLDPQIEEVGVGTIEESKNGVGLVGYTPHPDDPDPRPWPFPWPFPWPWVTVFSPNDLSLGIQFEGPNPHPFHKDNLMLNEKIAEIVGIEPFELTSENMETHFDKETGITTVLFHRSK